MKFSLRKLPLLAKSLKALRGENLIAYSIAERRSGGAKCLNEDLLLKIVNLKISFKFTGYFCVIIFFIKSTLAMVVFFTIREPTADFF